MNKKQPADDTHDARTQQQHVVDGEQRERKKQEIDKHMLPRGRVLGQGEMERRPSTD